MDNIREGSAKRTCPISSARERRCKLRAKREASGWKGGKEITKNKRNVQKSQKRNVTKKTRGSRQKP